MSYQILMLHTVSISNPDSFLPIKKETVIRMDLPQLFLCVLCTSYCLSRKLLSGLHSSCWKNSSSWKVWQINHLCHTVSVKMSQTYSSQLSFKAVCWPHPRWEENTIFPFEGPVGFLHWNGRAFKVQGGERERSEIDSRSSYVIIGASCL